MPRRTISEATTLSRKPAGFTLIELVISTAVILMMVAVSLPAFVEFQRRQDLITAAQLVRDGLLDVQNYALAPRGDSESGEEKIAGADYYRIGFGVTSGNQRWEIHEQTNTVNDLTGSPFSGSPPYPRTATWQFVKTRSLPLSVIYCDLQFNGQSVSYLASSASNMAAENDKGIIYSIGRLGKIVSPFPDGKYTVVLNNRSSGKQATVTVQGETSRIDIDTEVPPISCSYR